jgi:hypothetical protein
MTSRNRFSLVALLLVCTAFICCRLMYPGKDKPLQVTTWDALGYYLYLPAAHIYHDDTALAWFPAIDVRYNLSGGSFYQAMELPDGKKVFKYLRGVSLLQWPAFMLAHQYCLQTKRYPADGFSSPYQYAIAWWAILWVCASLFLLRNILLRFFSDHTVALALLLLLLASNAIQYIAVDGGQSHAWLFPLHVFMLWFTVRWHASYRAANLFGMAFVLGLSAIGRPTEAVLLFLPLLWNLNDPLRWKEKLSIVLSQPLQWFALVAGMLAGILPQLVYWKRVTGSWVFDVGSKWDFLSPHWRVLFGWEKGWFIYTPVALLFVAGLFFLRRFPFRSALITFCLLNIYIIISWHIWRYGGSYSTRALVQSYPVFAFPLSALLETWLRSRWRPVLLALSLCLISVNLFQIGQYNRGILHYDQTNRRYYGAIFLNPRPLPLHMSLLDEGDWHGDEALTNASLWHTDTAIQIVKPGLPLFDTVIQVPQVSGFFRVQWSLHSAPGRWNQFIHAALLQGKDTLKARSFRLDNALMNDREDAEYAFDFDLPAAGRFILWFEGPEAQGRQTRLKVQYTKSPQ